MKKKYREKELLPAILRRLKKPFNYLSVLFEGYRLIKHYNVVCNILKEKVEKKTKISVAFLIMYDTTFGTKPLFEKMLKDDIFHPFIIIIPDTLRSDDNMRNQLSKAYKRFVSLYGADKVVSGYDEKTANYIDYSDKFDIVCFSSPYDTMTHKYFQMNYLKQKNVLTFYIEYCHIGIHHYSRKHIVNLPVINMFWKIFTENEYCYKEYCHYQAIRGKNVAITGICKMDDYVSLKKTLCKRKRVIIAPHHTIGKEFENSLELSNFLEYADFFMELPLKYPDVDFIFRPHPLLPVTLARDDVWGRKRTDDYFKSITANENMVYSDGGDFFDLFVNSDALIHDCGSFLIDYLFTGYPCCFIVKNKKQMRKIFTRFGMMCLDHYYKAFTKGDIERFIGDIVIRGNDIFNNKRSIFVEKNFKLNYQNVSGKILEELKKAILINDKNKMAIYK
jgi:hypothetical protein